MLPLASDGYCTALNSGIRLGTHICELKSLVSVLFRPGPPFQLLGAFRETGSRLLFTR